MAEPTKKTRTGRGHLFRSLAVYGAGNTPKNRAPGSNDKGPSRVFEKMKKAIAYIAYPVTLA